MPSTRSSVSVWLCCLSLAAAPLTACSDDEDTSSSTGGAAGTSAGSAGTGAGTAGKGGAGQGGEAGQAGEAGNAGSAGSTGECATASDCPGSDTVCQKRTCDDGVCGLSLVVKGTPAGEQKAGDCQQLVCDGKGATEPLTDTTDLPDDGNPCTVDTCEDNQPKNSPASAGTACGTQTQPKVCDDKGACVECNAATDCPSGICQANKCVASSCADGFKNGGETDLDCGGPCGPCDDALDCVGGKDCKSGVCTNNECKAATCNDGVKNGLETGLDCGGTDCAKCGPGVGCAVDEDCLGGSCSGSVCLPTCTDLAKNGQETDQDCGGPTCGKCADTKGCELSSDCLSGVCTDEKCAAPTCTDGVKNGSEGDKDCGGSCDTKCANDQGCSVNGDCTSGVCAGGKCVPPSCGDGVKQDNEECDDGNKIATDACTDACKIAKCGDGAVQEGVETCDDANAVASDGCDACQAAPGYTCTGSPSSCAIAETEPNNSCSAVNGPYTVPFIQGGTFSSSSDKDYFSFTVPNFADVRIETFTTALGACPGTDDTYLTLYGPSCSTFIASDNNEGIGNCALIDPSVKAAARHLAPGTYYVAVDSNFKTLTSPYFTQVTFTALCGNGVKEGSEICDGTPDCGTDCQLLPVCGDGKVGGTETCDDGNTVAGDGCSAACATEAGYACGGSPSTCFPGGTETEDNGTCATANGPFAAPFVFGGVLPTFSDNDYVRFTLTSYSDVRVETFGPKVGECPSTVDTVVELRGTDCTTILVSKDQGGINNCSLINPSLTADAKARHLAPGTYYVNTRNYVSAPTTAGAYNVRVSLDAVCGDGNKQGSEECDGGANCQADCLLIPGCGDGKVQAGETCDDGNTTAGDGCSATCAPEAGYVCTGTPSVCVKCGDGKINGSETCDDGNATAGDGCSATCKIETGFTCAGTPSNCSKCGDGVVGGTETCDDGGTTSGNGCSSTCKVETNYFCTGSPSVCTIKESNCSDGVDNNGNGQIDCADPSCSESISCFSCGAGETKHVYSAVGLPKAIPDNGSTTATIAVPDAGTIKRVVTQVTIPHEFAADLDFSLTSPAGTTVELSTDNGGLSANYTSTVFDQSCSTSITSGTAPFSGCFKPEGNLTTLNNQAMLGTWTLNLTDDGAEDIGSLTSWSIAICSTN